MAKTESFVSAQSVAIARCEHRCRQLPNTLVEAFYGGLDAACRKLCRLTLPVPAAGRVPCWRTRMRWLVEVETSYVLHQEQVREQLMRKTGSTVSLSALRIVARAMGDSADHTTGRSSRLSLATLCERTGLHERVVQRARTVLELLGLATEAQRGRHRSLEELRKRPRWDRSRGWASVWHLHPPRPAQMTTGQEIVNPPRSGSFKTVGSSKKNSLSVRVVEKPTRKTGPRVEQLAGIALGARWQRHPHTPPWAAGIELRSLGRVLAPLAAHGWSAGDLNAAVAEHGPVIGRSLAPDRPLSWLRWLCEQVEPSRPPSAASAAAAQRQAEESERRRAEHEAGRVAGLAALAGPGRAAALAAVGLRPRPLSGGHTCGAGSRSVATDALAGTSRRFSL